MRLSPRLAFRYRTLNIKANAEFNEQAADFNCDEHILHPEYLRDIMDHWVSVPLVSQDQKRTDDF